MEKCVIYGIGILNLNVNDAVRIYENRDVYSYD
jgi:hypothetical protein